MRRFIWPLMAAVLIVAGGAGYVVGDIYDVVPGPLTRGHALPQGERLVEPAGYELTHTPVPQQSAGTIDAAALAQLVSTAVQNLSQPPAAPAAGAAAQPFTPPEVAIEVLDGNSGASLAAHAPDAPLPAASSAKLLVATTALKVLGPNHHFTTEVKAAGNALTLVAGGDQLLADDQGNSTAVRGHAGLGDLARACADKLHKQGITSVTLTLDDGSWGDRSPLGDWAADGNSAYEGPVAAMAIETGLVKPPVPVGYMADPALYAATRFAAHLQAAGITVSGDIGRGAPSSDAATLASVSSAPLSQIVRTTLKDSDNVLADGLCRASALATAHEASFSGGVAAVRATLSDLGVAMDHYDGHDCSGLSSNNRMTASILAHTLQLAVDGTHEPLKGIPAALPVAGLDGTLHDRLVNTGGEGVVRAKTGSLQQVRSLTGVVETTSGTPLVFSIIVSHYGSEQTGKIVGDIDAFANGLAAL